MVEKNKGTLDKVFKEKNISNLQEPLPTFYTKSKRSIIGTFQCFQATLVTVKKYFQN